MLLFFSIQLSFHVNVYNLFDIRNELTVYGDTGRASYSLIPTYTPQYSGPMLNNLDEFLVVPSYCQHQGRLRLDYQYRGDKSMKRLSALTLLLSFH